MPSTDDKPPLPPPLPTTTSTTNHLASSSQHINTPEPEKYVLCLCSHVLR